MFRVMSPFVINVPTRYLLVPYTVVSNYGWHISITIIVMFVNTKHRYWHATILVMEINLLKISPEHILRNLKLFGTQGLQK